MSILQNNRTGWIARNRNWIIKYIKQIKYIIVIKYIIYIKYMGAI